MSEQKEKRMVSDSGYEVRQSIHIGRKEILLAENPNAEDGQYWLVGDYRENGLIVEYSMCETSNDYLEAVQEYSGRITSTVEAIRAEHDARGLPADIITAEQCKPHDYADDLNGKVVAIKASVFSPEYRRGDYQLVLVDGGNGAMPNLRGNAVYCIYLSTGEKTRFERYDVLGVVKDLPDWAQKRLAEITAPKEKAVTETEYAGRYEIIERTVVGKKVFALGHNADGVQTYGTWVKFDSMNRGYDAGHYFDTYEAAKTDLQERVTREQGLLERHTRSKPER